MAKILVTGATGFVGKRLVPELIAAGHEVRCAVSRRVDWLHAEQVVVDKLEHNPDWGEALSGMDVVIHLAARVHVMKEKAEFVLDDYCKINSIATRNLAKQAAKHHVKRFIFLSSIKVNGEFTLKGTPFTEESSAQPEDPYGQSKLYAEQYLRVISQNTGLEVVIIRPPLIYGPEVKANFLRMLRLVKKGLPLPFGKVENSRHLVYVGNLVSALCMVVAHPEAANQTYLVADDDSLSLTQLMSLIGYEMNVNVRLIPIPVRFMEFSFRILGLSKLNMRLFGSLEVSNNKIKSQLGWVPPVSSTEGLKETVKWYQCESNS
ncbi:UDP-glucose 4-epimerase family protein [Legionella drancourtii]|uniref:NAD dependent epimerase/dehydratase, UDP-glucose-4-epimerase n=1 Tax=Legionella drancourtii LLAP12 TaxID=658187 RepID=G9EJ99_9GAMM|nr:SDR family oxidoreductase [Legionella drancourtii]EHL32665.1 NAD dependent epimerase/dehydratase, UDP-glucose-4-epimerase [Legionella drancourtii LLAP12]